MTSSVLPRAVSARAVSVRADADPPRVIKSFDDASEARHEARWLAQAAHPGVVRLLGHGEHHLETALVAGSTLRTRGPAPRDAASVLASVANSLAELHDRGFLHAHLTPDHILLETAAEHRGVTVHRALLCSPRGASPLDLVPEAEADPDGSGFHRCVQWLIEDWSRRGVDVPPGWIELERTLSQRRGPVSFRRIRRRLEVLAPPRPRSPSPPASSSSPASSKPLDRRRRRMAVLAVGVIASLSGLIAAGMIAVDTTWRGADSVPSRNPVGVADLGDGRYVVLGRDGSDQVLARVERPCPGQPHLLLLETTTGVIWAFEDVSDEATATPWARAVGADGLEVESDTTSGCPRLWATGPAGRSRLADASPAGPEAQP